MSNFFAYCDESGQRDYGPGTDPYFVVAAVIARGPDAAHLEDEIRGLKRAFWGSPEIELKSNWVRRPAERKRRYLDPHGVTSKDLADFIGALYRWLAKAPISLLAGVVDKPLMEERYASPHYAGGVAYTMLLQRFQKYASKRGGSGAVIFDDPSGKSPGGYEWRLLLQKQHARLLKSGCPYTKTKFTSLGPLTFTDSKASPLVQVADVVAYNTFRQFRDHGAAWEDPKLTKLPTYDHFEKILPLFDKGPGKEFAGYGVAKWPFKVKVPWCLE